MQNVIFRKATEDDAENIAAIERLCFKSFWTVEMILSEMKEPLASFYCAEFNGELIAYYGFLHILDELHILNVAVAPSYQKQRHGSALMKHMESIARNLRIRAITLEVRESNQPAIRLYEKFGFECAGVRPHYYMDKENALIYWKEL